MARFARRPRATNATIRGFYNKDRFLKIGALPGTLKLTMMGFGRRGGVLLRQEKLRRKLPKQLRGVNARSKTKRIVGT